MKNRTTLRSYFLTNSIPTQANFHDFIDSGLNQEEDGIRKADKGPIELEAQGTGGELLNLYSSFKESALLWTISHKPAKKGEEGTAGLNIADAQASRLFIKAGDGNVGIGTSTPTQKLEVAGVVYTNSENAGFIADAGGSKRVGLLKYGGREGGIWRTNAQDFEIGRVNVDALPGAPSSWTTDLYVAGNGNVGIGTDNPLSKLDVGGSIRTTRRVAIDSSNIGKGEVGSPTALDNALSFGSEGTGEGIGSNRTAGGVNMNGLDLYTGYQKRLCIANNGNVGVGTSTPASRLQVVSANNEDAQNIFDVQAQNLTQGVGLWWGGIRKTGTNPNSDLALDAKGNGPVLLNAKSGTGNVGIGTPTPTSRLDVRTDDGSAAITVGTKGNTGGAVYLGHPNHGVRRGFPEVNSNNHVGLYTTGADIYLSGAGANTSQFVLTSAGNVGIGTDAPLAPLEIRRPSTSPYLLFHTPNVRWFSFGQDRGQEDNIKISDGNGFGGANYLTIQRSTSNVGIGTTTPSVPLDVSGARALTYEAVYSYLNPGATGINFKATLQDVSIRASRRIVAGEFNATSDARLKTIIGHSDHAADLALLGRLRITDYTMRDRVQFGDRAFKKIIAQELEEVFPQAVHQNTDFLPDIYATAIQVQHQGEALLITLPAGLAEAATAGQRLKLIGPAGEVLATLAEAADAGSLQLLVAGADSLANTPEEVFVFGLERSDVRTVDYEAVAMLNVSATQTLARQVEELHQQNAALNEQNRAQSTQLGELQAELHTLQQQVAQLLSETKRVAQPA